MVGSWCSVASTLDCQSRGRGFKSRRARHNFTARRRSLVAALSALLLLAAPASAQELSLEVSRKRPDPRHQLPAPAVAEQAAQEAAQESLVREQRERTVERWRAIDRRQELRAQIIRATQHRALRHALRR